MIFYFRQITIFSNPGHDNNRSNTGKFAEIISWEFIKEQSNKNNVWVTIFFFVPDLRPTRNTFSNVAQCTMGANRSAVFDVNIVIGAYIMCVDSAFRGYYHCELRVRLSGCLQTPSKRARCFVCIGKCTRSAERKDEILGVPSSNRWSSWKN